MKEINESPNFKVLIIADSDPRKAVIGGIGIYAFNLAAYLTSRNIGVIFLGKKQGGKIINNFKNFEFIELNKKPNQSNYIFLKNLFKLTKTLKMGPNVVIHSQRPDWLVPFSKFKNKKIVTLHGSHSKNVYLKKGYIIGRLYSHLEKKGLILADKIISVSDDNAKYYKTVYKNFPDIIKKIIRIPIGINAERFKHISKSKSRRKYGFSKNDKIAVYIGRFEKEKNIKLMIKACKEANIKLFLVGEGRDKHELKRFAIEIGADVTFHSTVSNAKIPSVLGCADVFVLTSLYEGLPTVLIETLAAGIPIISTDVGDVKKLVINGRTGFLVDENNIANKLKMLIKEGRKYRENCIKLAEKYSWRKIGAKLMKLYIIP